MRLINANLLERALEEKMEPYKNRETKFVDGVFLGMCLAKQIAAEQPAVNAVVITGGKHIFKDGSSEGVLAYRCPECGGWMGYETYGQHHIWECGNCGFRPTNSAECERK